MTGKLNITFEAEQVELNLDNGVHVELDVQASYDVDYDYETFNHNCPPGEDAGPDCFEYDVTKCSVDDYDITYAYNDDDDMLEQYMNGSYRLNENEMKRLESEIMDYAVEDFDRHDYLD